MEHAPSWVVPVTIAIGTAVIVPSLVWIGRRIAQAWHDHRVKLLSEVFMPRDDFERLEETQSARHIENQRALESLRLEGKEREGRLVGMIDTARKDQRDEVRQLVSSVGDVHRRVDSILTLLGDRRRQD